MPFHEFSLLAERQQEPQRLIGGGARVARIFLPAIENSAAIRLVGRGHRRSGDSRNTARRELARAIDWRRRAS